MTIHSSPSDELTATLTRVATAFGVTVAQLLAPDRSRALTQARSAAVLLLYRQYPQLSFQSIGDALGGRTRETIRETLARAEDYALTDPAFASTLQTLLAER